MSLLGVVASGCPLVTAPSYVLDPATCVYTVPHGAASPHIVVFLTGCVALPPGYVARLYLVTPPQIPGQPPLWTPLLPR